MKLMYILTGALLLFGGGFALYALLNGKNPDHLNQLLDDYNYVIGTQTVGSKYQFTDETMLVETAKEIKNMGSNLLKFSMNPRYCTENYGLPKNDSIKSLLDLATMEPSVKKVLDMDFKYYHIWVYGFSQYTEEPEGEKRDTNQIKFIGGYPDEYANALYQELYDLTSYFLKKYNNSGKIFYLGHWEGDWHLRWHFDRTKPVDIQTLQGMKKWELVRQKAIDDAKRDISHENVEIYNYIEVNLVKIGMEEGAATVTNSVLEVVNPDYVSYSAYDTTNPYKSEEALTEGLHEGLDYIESFLQPKSGLPEGKRVWIGEYGSPTVHYSEEEQNERSVWSIKAGLKWGSPFILYWELYNNEIDKETGEQVGYWMIDDSGEKQKIWYTYQQFYEEARSFVNRYYLDHGDVPDFDTFRDKALEFNALN
ncbi:hypothetical protein [Marinilabilia rubra]|uniref:Glycoside hydrolase family 42 N-terminal domain-containing protein n=1 Tax=Marinilabilia rubra TaxID=2162893 RepID=A0A2U2B7D8_9BACT|nr:hypothetical protein [Marinilabilia rubra]PWD98954.1 hypothetical protein DDZ16_13235 [Marinilabilia rubra]